VSSSITFVNGTAMVVCMSCLVCLLKYISFANIL